METSATFAIISQHTILLYRHSQKLIHFRDEEQRVVLKQPDSVLIAGSLLTVHLFQTRNA